MEVRQPVVEMPSIPRWSLVLEWALLIGVMVDLTLSAIVDVLARRIGKPDEHLFAAAGALMVMAGVIIEFRYQEFSSKWNFRQLQRATAFGGAEIEPLPDTYRWRLGVGRITGIVGTLIWAYGSLII